MNQLETTVFKMLADRQRINNKTDITQYTRYIRAQLPNTTPEDVLAFFKNLEAQGKGVVIIGRRGNPDRFIWNYNLREVAQNALGNKTEASPAKQAVKVKRKVVAKRKAGRPAGSKNRTVKIIEPKDLSPTLNFSIQLSTNTRPEDIQALIELANSLKV